MSPIIVAGLRGLWDWLEPPRRVVTWTCAALAVLFASDQIFQLFTEPDPNNVKPWQALYAIAILVVAIVLLNLGRRRQRDVG